MPSESAPAFQFGDIVLVRFPFTNQSGSKQRPAVVVSNSRYNLARPDVVIMAITSQLGSALSDSDLPIAQWQPTGLLKPSSVKPVFATIEQALIVRRLGALHQSDLSALRSAIVLIFG